MANYANPPYYLTAYGLAVKHGYKGTEEEFVRDIYGGAARADIKAEIATEMAETAAEKALDSEAYGAGTRGGEAVTEDDPAYHNNAMYYAQEAAGSAETAGDSAEAAAASEAAAKDYSDNIGTKSAGVVADWLNDNMQNPDSPPLDRSLQQALAAAPADLVGDVKSAIDNIGELYPDIELSLASGNITDTGSTTTTNSRIRSAGNSNYTPIVAANDYYYIKPPYEARVAIFDSKLFNSSHFIAWVNTTYRDGIIAIPADYIGRYAAIVIRKVGYYDSDISGDVATITNYVQYYRPSIIDVDKIKIAAYDGGATLGGQTVNTLCYVSETDAASITDFPTNLTNPTTTYSWLLTAENADKNRKIQMLFRSRDDLIYLRYYREGTWSSWISTEYAEMSRSLDELYTAANLAMPMLYSDIFIWEMGKGIASNGGDVSHSGVARTGHFPVSPGDVFIGRAAATNADDVALTLFICTYKSGVFYKRTQLDAGVHYIIPADVTSVRFSYGYSSSAGLTITKYQLSQYFASQYSGWYYGWKVTDRPLLVAIGASTTDATIHNYTGIGLTKSQVAFPEYAASCLNLKCCNLGVGTTGFLKRGDSGNSNNFLDQIYTNGDALSRASVVVLMFGYGNDGAAGLPIGVYTDYYPYDEEGYHPSGEAGIATMLSKGITLMGALNWCIKWINEHYPMAQVIPIFGAPSANKDRTITMTAQSEGAGVAPYTLAFADPYGDGGMATNKKIKQISEELQKLKAALNIPIVDMMFDGGAFSWWATNSTKQVDGNTVYSLFSTTGTPESPTWNSHPNEDGYLAYSRIIAGRVAGLVQYRY